VKEYPIHEVLELY